MFTLFWFLIFFFKNYQELIDYPTVHGDICCGIGVVDSVRKKMVCQELESSYRKEFSAQWQGPN